MCPQSSAQSFQASRVLVKAERVFSRLPQCTQLRELTGADAVSLWACEVCGHEFSVAGVYFQNKYEGKKIPFSQSVFWVRVDAIKYLMLNIS